MGTLITQLLSLVDSKIYEIDYRLEHGYVLWIIVIMVYLISPILIQGYLKQDTPNGLSFIFLKEESRWQFRAKFGSISSKNDSPRFS